MKLKISYLALSVSLICGNAVAAPFLMSSDVAPQEQQAMQSNSWVEVSKATFENNIRLLKKEVGSETKICAVMKADAYGNGIENLIPSVINNDISCIAIASNEEAKMARKKGFKGQIVRVRAGTIAEIEAAVQFNVEELIGTYSQAEAISKLANKYDTDIAVHLAFNSGGMGRNGIDLSTDEGKEEALKITQAKRVNIVGMMTHFPTEDLDKTRAGLERFKQETSWLIQKSDLNREYITLHAANSYTTLMLPEARLDMVRPGGALYGDTTPVFPEYKSVVTFKTQVASIHHFPAGTTVGYDSTEVLSRPSVLANLPVGYSDGYPRSLSRIGYVLINGKKAKIVGKTSMNTTMVDITDIEGVHLGDEVVLYGQQGHEEITRGELEEKSGRLFCDLYTLWGSSNPKYLK
ncbi:Alanine racemase [Photobacterium marinum]|uniref:Broad specificity amino-acid racemase n=1 Tax=Photobacterium marinum TaxID=1056511 RepID=L8J6K5_9GAMM|nr:alanine racemase [Photobacterium marinum]ELR63808.1 Alanine racemase [Photobacterium marinum]